MTRNTTQSQMRAEVAAMKGHSEARNRLEELDGWSEAEVGSLEDAAHGYVDFARCVAGELRYRRGNDGEVVNY